MSKDYWFWVKHHICANCCNADTIKGQVYCASCAEINRKRAARYIANRSEEQIAIDNLRKKQRRECWESENKCKRCGHSLEPQTIGFYKSCEKCRAKMRRRYRENRPPETLPHLLRTSHEYCYMCCKPIDRTDNKTLCDKCRQICIGNLSHVTPEGRERSKKAFKELNQIFWNGVKAKCTTE